MQNELMDAGLNEWKDPSLEIFEHDKLYDQTIQNMDFTRFSTTNGNVKNESAFDINVGLSSRVYMNLYHAYILLYVRTYKNDTEDPWSSGAQKFMLNNILDALKSISLKLNGSEVDDCDQLGLANWIYNQIFQSHDVSKERSRLTQIHHYLGAVDRGGGNVLVGDWLTAYKSQMGSDNNGSTDGMVCAINLRDILGFCRTNKVIKGAHISLSFVKNTTSLNRLYVTNDTTIVAGDKNPVVKIEKCELYAPVITPESGIAWEMSEALNTNRIPAKYSFFHQNFRRYPNQTQGDGKVLELVQSVKRPMFVAVGLVSDTINNSINENSYQFDVPFKNAYLTVNEKNYPKHYIQPETINGKKHYLRSYINFLRASGKSDSKNTEAMSYDMWENSYHIVVFDLTQCQEYLNENSNHLVLNYDTDSGGAHSAHVLILDERHLELNVVNDQVDAVLV